MAARDGRKRGRDGSPPWTAYVRDMSWITSEELLREAFSRFGEVVESNITYDPVNDSGASGFVTFKDEEAMIRSIEYMDGLDFQGRTINVSRDAAAKRLRRGRRASAKHRRKIRRDAAKRLCRGRLEFSLISPGGRSIPFERSVLASQSPAFRGMMELGIEECINTSIKKFSKASDDTFQAFVDYLNTSEAPHLVDEDTARDLFILADLAEVWPLMTCCETFLQSIVTWENALPLYAFAHIYNAYQLRDDCLQLLSRDIAKLSERQDYAQLLEDDPDIIITIYEAASKRN